MRNDDPSTSGNFSLINEANVNLPGEAVDQELARTLQTLLGPGARESGSLIGEVIGHYRDRASLWRAKNLIRMVHDAKQTLMNEGIPEDQMRSIPFRDVQGILQDASDVEADAEPELASLWSSLIASSLKPSTGVEADRLHRNILKQMRGRDAVVFKFIALDKHAVLRAVSPSLPEDVRVARLLAYLEEVNFSGEPLNPETFIDVVNAGSTFSLMNLDRLGLTEPLEPMRFMSSNRLSEINKMPRGLDLPQIEPARSERIIKVVRTQTGRIDSVHFQVKLSPFGEHFAATVRLNPKVV